MTRIIIDIDDQDETQEQEKAGDLRAMLEIMLAYMVHQFTIEVQA